MHERLLNQWLWSGFSAGGTCLSWGACPPLWLHPGTMQRTSVHICPGRMDLQRWGMAASHQVHMHRALT